MYERGISVEVIGVCLGINHPPQPIRYLGIDEAQAKSAALTHDIFGKSKSKLSDVSAYETDLSLG